MRRRRVVYCAAIVSVILLGLASRKFPGVLFPPMLGKYPGDVLWALAVFLVWGWCRRDAQTSRLAVYALFTAYADEFSQVYQAPWINAIRETAVGHLLLGSTFSWWDMTAYTVGVGVGVVCELAGRRVLFSES